MEIIIQVKTFLWKYIAQNMQGVSKLKEIKT